MATNWGNIVARWKFLVASLYNVNDATQSQGFWYFAPSQSREINKNTQNTAKFGRNIIKYMSVQHIWNFSQLLGLSTCRKLVNLSSRNSETTRRRLCAKNWALAMMLKALPLVQFWSVLLLKEQMMTSVRKTLKMLVWSAQNRLTPNEVFPEKYHKIALFWPIDFRLSLPRKFLRNRSIFQQICPYKFREIWLFFRDLSEALHSMVWSIRFENVLDRSWYKFGGKLAFLAHFFERKPG